MRHFALLLLIGIVMGGCEQQSAIGRAIASCKSGEFMKGDGTCYALPATKKAVIAALDEKTKKMGLKWRVVCMPWVDENDDPFLANAWHAETDASNPHSDRWLLSGPTQLATAQQLLIALDGAPTHPAEPIEPKPAPKPHKICPPAWSGGSR